MNGNNTIGFLMSDAAAAERRIRNKTGFVIWVEAAGLFELDADDMAHARALASNWTRPEVGAVSASVRKVKPSGHTRCLDVFCADDNTAAPA